MNMNTYLYKQASSVSSIRVSVRGLCLARAHTLPPLYRQINREDRLVVREGVCVLGRARNHSPSLDTNFLSNATGNKCYG